MSEPPPETAAQGLFPKTRWTLVRELRAADDAAAGRALADLCAGYWAPIYAFLRQRGQAPHDAEDLTQSFLASLLSRDIFARAEPELGRLRTFLLANLQHFLANERRLATRQKRGGGWQAVPLDTAALEEELGASIADHENPARAFDRAFAVALLQRVLRELEEEYRRLGKEALFAELRPCLVEGAAGPEGYREAAGRLQMSEGHLRVAAHRLRVRYREMLVQAVADTVDGPAALGDELGYLLRLFR